MPVSYLHTPQLFLCTPRCILEIVIKAVKVGGKVNGEYEYDIVK